MPPKKIPYVQGQRRSPRKMEGGAKLHLESNPIPTRDTWRVQTNLVLTRTQRPPETETELCLSVSSRGTGEPWTAAGVGTLGVIDLDMA